MLKKLVAMLAVMTTVVWATSALAGYMATVLVINHTTVDIVSFQATPSGVSTWGPDLLGGTGLWAGEGVYVDFYDTCYYDFRAVYADGYVDEDYGVDVCVAGSFHYIEG